MIDTNLGGPSSGADWASGEMAERIRTFDWSATPLGAIESWSPTLRSMIRIMLANRFPHILWWGPSYVQFYNDAYRPIPGTKHPERALGIAASECWPEIWHVIKPLIDRPFHGGPATWDDDIFLEVNRHGFREESHFTIAYSPVPDDTVASGIGGVLATVHEITEKVIGERRLTVLRDLGARMADARTADDACAIAAEVFAAHDKDVPFVLLYLTDPATHVATLAGATGIEPGKDISPLTVDLRNALPGGWPLREAMRDGAVVFTDLRTSFAAVPAGPWDDPPDSAFVTTIPASRLREPAGFMVAGLSARLKWDRHYQDFLELAKAQIASAINNARAYEEEKQRAEKLAELDRAKTTFFSNVSHEFRTPLTLMLGPVEDLLMRRSDELSAAAKEDLAVVGRNGLRLLRLVNSLLDFSRIEAGRMQATYEPTDLARFTEELASLFRSACERAGLTLTVDCDTLPEPAFVDRAMWEKIVLNLLSNAFKFTQAGRIAVSLRTIGDKAELRVADTGTGIPADELPRIFERFHRVQGTHGRTHEGAGIGLALTLELIKLHGGTIRADSTPGAGTTFIVEIPMGKAHLPADRIGAHDDAIGTSTDPRPFVEEALRWLPHGAPATAPAHAPAADRAPEALPHAPGAGRPRILVADDNADMRQYLARLLSKDYEVELANDGQDALARIHARSVELLLTDVMMPGLDGLGLLHALRTDPKTADLPIIMLSARAGEESLAEGVEAGADDYLTKPFSARELLARVGTHVKMARFRREALEALRHRGKALREADRRKDEFLNILAHELRGPLATISNTAHILGQSRTDTELARDAQKRIERQLRHLVRLVDDLLDTNRITQGKLQLHIERVELQAAIRDAIETCRPLAEELEREVTLDVPAESIWLDADPVRLAQVIGNLLSNAYKYTEHGGHVWLSVEPRGDEVLLRVKDDGVGIPAAALPSIFDLFMQVRSSLNRARGGLGIGLALVKRLVDMHGGQVEGFSDGPSRGSEFVVRLPMPVGAVGGATVIHPPAANAAATAALQILVVDDDQDSAWSLAALLDTCGHRVQTAHDGFEAIATAEQYRPDVILMDIGLPTITGHEAARRIRAESWGVDIVLIAVSGWGQEEDRRRSDEAGFDAHLVKPVDLDALLGLLQRRRDSAAG
ncbi:response regulator [Cupriavidus pinatubonensis]|uniref:ATP-binding protein n=1 Tax=Cupriavidus pinatubonensis TaxID=248026 RepID=UPI001C73997D|nr:ATP-binding protein [Cupriavidus pinatubonensis]QYY28418.1 response regulator [Cupriavidus pinatubonensis]